MCRFRPVVFFGARGGHTISIHQMCRFRSFLSRPSGHHLQFQYIKCAGSACGKMVVSCFEGAISIHQMCRFRGEKISLKRGCFIDFNTSNVPVPLRTCWGLEGEDIDFNTSNVPVPPQTRTSETVISRYFNTSNVPVPLPVVVVTVADYPHFNTSNVPVPLGGKIMAQAYVRHFNTSNVPVPRYIGRLEQLPEDEISIHQMCRFRKRKTNR